MLAVVLAAFVVCGYAVAANAPVPTGTSTIALPGDLGMAFKPGAGAEVAERYCLQCHSSAYVSRQPLLSSAQWTAEIKKMRTAFGAAIPDDQVPALVTYLTAEYGKP